MCCVPCIFHTWLGVNEGVRPPLSPSHAPSQSLLFLGFFEFSHLEDSGEDPRLGELPLL